MKRPDPERAPGLGLYHPRDEDREKLRQLSEQRNSLIKSRTREKNRLQGPCSEHIKASIERTIGFLDQEIEHINKEIEENNVFKEECQAIKKIPGIGKVVANTLIVNMPELGHVTHKQIASLGGLAPHPGLYCQKIGPMLIANKLAEKISTKCVFYTHEERAEADGLLAINPTGCPYFIR